MFSYLCINGFLSNDLQRFTDFKYINDLLVNINDFSPTVSQHQWFVTNDLLILNISMIY